MTLSASDRIDRILSGKQICPLDWINLTIHYSPRPEPGTEYTNRLTSAAKLSYVVANEMSNGLRDRLAFRASGMSNGDLAYELVENCTGTQENNIYEFAKRRFGKDGVKTTQNLKNTVAGSELLNRVILPNREADFRAANVMEEKFPDLAWVYPIGYENAVRMQKASNALSQGASYQDWTFEYWWGARVIDMSHHNYDGEKRFASRNLGIEDNMANMIQLGYLDEFRPEAGPGREMDIMDRNGKHVPLADRAWGRAKHVFEVTEKGFATDLAISVLIGEFMMDDWLRGESQPEGFPALDMDKVHPVLAKRSKAELARMDKLKEMMLPYLAEKCVDFLPFYEEDPNLKKYIEEKVLPAKGQFKDLSLSKVRTKLFSENIRGDMNGLDIKKKKTTGTSAKFDKAANANSFAGKPAKRRDTDGGYFKDTSRLFDDRNFSKLSLWEQAALPYIMGAAESFRLPESAPRAMFYIAEPKGGALAAEYMEERNIDWLKEAYSAESPTGKNSFAKKVIAKNKEQTPKDVEALAGADAVKARGIINIVSTNNFLSIAEAAEKYRDFVAAKGPQELSPRARLALMTEWLHRNPEAIAVRKDWDVHHDETTLMVEALKVATGLVERPYNGGDFKMEIFAYDQDSGKLEKQDLYDLVTKLGKRVDDMLSKNPPPEAKEHYLAMARMIQILDMYMDPGRMNTVQVTNPHNGKVSSEEIIAWREVDPSLMGFWHEDPEKKAELKAFRDHIREKLVNVGVLYFDENDLEGLHEDYKAAWYEAQGEDASQRRKQYEGRQTFQDWKGPT